MKLPRRQFLHLAAGAAVLPAVPRIAAAQAYPTRPVRIVVTLPAGSSVDIMARAMAQWLTERIGQPFVVDNRPGASGNLGTEVVVRSAPDGYTLLLVNLSNAINASVYDKLNFNFIRDIAPVAWLSRTPVVMEVTPSLPAKTVPDFIAYAKTNPGKVNMASAGTGSLPHAAGELFKMMTSIDMLHVPYRGAPQAITDMLAGQVHVMFDVVPSSIEHIKAGRLRPLAVATASRLDVLPETPTVADFVPGYEASGWSGLGAPKGTPVDIVDRLNKEINAWLGRSADEIETVELRLHDRWGYVCRFRQANRGRNREVGQGSQVCWHQAGVTRRSRQHIP